MFLFLWQVISLPNDSLAVSRNFSCEFICHGQLCGSFFTEVLAFCLSKWSLCLSLHCPLYYYCPHLPVSPICLTYLYLSVLVCLSDFLSVCLVSSLLFCLLCVSLALCLSLGLLVVCTVRSCFSAYLGLHFLTRTTSMNLPSRACSSSRNVPACYLHPCTVCKHLASKSRLRTQSE